MKTVHGKAVATVVHDVDKDYGEWGGFTAVLSTPSLDRDGDRLHRDEWIEPLQESYPLDIDHGMSVEDTVGSFHPYFDGDMMMMDAYFAPDEKSQRVRGLVDHQHIRAVSVAFLTDKSKKDGEPRRELLNAGIVAVPANRDAIILHSKGLAEELDLVDEKGSPKPYGDVTYADPEEGKYPIDTVAHIRAALAYIGMPRNRAALGSHLAHVEAAIHAAARAHGINIADDRGKSLIMTPNEAREMIGLIKAPGHWCTSDECGCAGNDCSDAEYSPVQNDAVKPSDVDSKAPGGTGDGPALTQAIHDASVHLGAMCYPLPEPDADETGASDGANKSTLIPLAAVITESELPEGMDVEQFKSALKEALTPRSPEEPAPADEAAAAPSAEDWGQKAAMLRMRHRLPRK